MEVSFVRADSHERLASARARLGSTLGGKFRLLRLIGVGGMAAVFEAQHKNGKKVALKVLHRSLDASDRERKRFLREAYVANTIAHPGVVQIFDDGVDASGAIYLVMELLEGATLADLQRASGGRLEPSLVLNAADQLLDVLTVAHARGVIHRDIKPANLFVTKEGHLKVLDFGIARVFEAIPGATVETQSGTMLGTPGFMPQEQARGRWSEVDARSDLWAVGATLFTLLTGEHVHCAETPNEQLGRAMTLPARSLATVDRGASASLVNVIDRALRFEPDERWQDAPSMREALRSVADGREGPELGSTQAWARALAGPEPREILGATTLSAGASLPHPSRLAVARGRLGWLSLALAVLAAIGLAGALAPARPEPSPVMGAPARAAERSQVVRPSASVSRASQPQRAAVATPSDVIEPLPTAPPKPSVAPSRPKPRRPSAPKEQPDVAQEPARVSDPLDLRF